jgi:hypothetical protein
MLSYLDTVGRLTALRDGLRETLNSESGDRQATVELTEMTLTKLLGELVTPDAPPAATITVDLVISGYVSDTPACSTCNGCVDPKCPCPVKCVCTKLDHNSAYGKRTN